MRKSKYKFKSKRKGDVYLAHIACASDSGPQCIVDSVRRVQPLWRLLILPSLSSFFFSTKRVAPLTPIELSKAHNFNFFQLELAYT
jgi:hypothetical protein